MTNSYATAHYYRIDYMTCPLEFYFDKDLDHGEKLNNIPWPTSASKVKICKYWWVTDLPTYLLNGVGTLDAYASKSIAQRIYLCQYQSLSEIYILWIVTLFIDLSSHWWLIAVCLQWIYKGFTAADKGRPHKRDVSLDLECKKLFNKTRVSEEENVALQEKL